MWIILYTKLFVRIEDDEIVNRKLIVQKLV